MNCGSCGRHLYATSRVCPCGWKVPAEMRPAVIVEDRGETRAIIARKMAERQREVNLYIQSMRDKIPGISKKDACMQYMKEKGLLATLGKFYKEEDDEARAERAAIQSESDVEF